MSLLSSLSSWGDINRAKNGPHITKALSRHMAGQVL